MEQIRVWVDSAFDGVRRSRAQKHDESKHDRQRMYDPHRHTSRQSHSPSSSQMYRCWHELVPTGGTVGTSIGRMLGGGIGAICGGFGGTMSSVLSQSGTCRHEPLEQSQVQVQLARAEHGAISGTRTAKMMTGNADLRTVTRQGCCITSPSASRTHVLQHTPESV